MFVHQPLGAWDLTGPNGKFQPQLGKVSNVRPDGIHFSPVGSRLVANWLLGYVTSARPDVNLLRTGPIQTTSVLLYGSTNVYEARKDLIGYFNDLPYFSLTIRSQPFGSLCDVAKTLRADIAAKQPKYIMIYEAGDVGATCPRDASSQPLQATSPAFYVAYKDAADRVASAAAGLPIIFIQPPAAKTPVGRAHLNRISAIIADLTNTHPAITVSSIVHEEFGGDTWQERLECRATEKHLRECVSGTIAVHGPDGSSFCPDGYPTLADMIRGCKRYASGANRLADSLTKMIIEKAREPTVAP